MRLSELTAATRTIAVSYLTYTLNVTYRPGVMTPDEDDRIQAARETNTATDALIDLMSRLLAAWDVVDDDDKPLPVTPALLRSMPSGLLLAIMAAVQADMVPNVMTGRR